MSAPIVSGSAALVMESLREKSQSFTPNDIKIILMSSAEDLENDVFTQGVGLVDALEAIRAVNGNGGTFTVYNSESSSNIESILKDSFNSVNSTALGMEKFQISLKDIPQTSWFGGRIMPGDSSSTIFTIANPTNKTLDIKITPQKLELVDKLILNAATEPLLQDSIMNKSKTYRPNYIPLSDFSSQIHSGKTQQPQKA